jgi:hypothetical protein
MARRKTALRLSVLGVAAVACVTAAWVTSREAEWWVWLVAVSAVLNVITTWGSTGEAARTVALAQESRDAH